MNTITIDRKKTATITANCPITIDPHRHFVTILDEKSKGVTANISFAAIETLYNIIKNPNLK